MSFRVVVVALSVALSGCGKLFHDPNAPTMKLEYSMNGVKVIAPEIRRGDDASAWGRETYDLSPTRRLLVRFESLGEHTDMISVDNGRTVEIRVWLADDDADGSARQALQLCPLTKSWMMLATWVYAHPFGGDGRWTSPGGDYDSGSCLAQVNDPEERRQDPRRVTFDAKPWFVNWARGRNTNYGLILVPTKAVRVKGDASGPQSPRLSFEKFLPVIRITPGEPPAKQERE